MRSLKTALEAMLESESQPPSEISVLIAGEEEIGRLNREFRGVEGSTDVLSFPEESGSPVPPGSLRFLGDIAICYPVAEKQAAARGTSTETELACLAVHGGLHLLGYRHDNLEQYDSMNRKMNEAVRATGLEPVDEWGSLPH